MYLDVPVGTRAEAQAGCQRARRSLEVFSGAVGSDCPDALQQTEQQELTREGLFPSFLGFFKNQLTPVWFLQTWEFPGFGCLFQLPSPWGVCLQGGQGVLLACYVVGENNAKTVKLVSLTKFLLFIQKQKVCAWNRGSFLHLLCAGLNTACVLAEEQQKSGASVWSVHSFSFTCLFDWVIHVALPFCLP